MSDPERRNRIEALIVRWQERLRLQDWDIDLSSKAPHDGNPASIVYEPENMKASIAVDANILEQVEEPMVLHEMLELVLQELDGIFAALLKEVPDQLHRSYQGQQEAARHHAIHKFMSAFLGPGCVPFNELPRLDI